MSSSYSVAQPSSLLVLVVSTCIPGLETCIEMLLKQMRQINVRLRGQRFVTWRTSNESKSNQHPSNLNKNPMVSSFQLLFCRKKSRGILGSELSRSWRCWFPTRRHPKSLAVMVAMHERWQHRRGAVPASPGGIQAWSCWNQWNQLEKTQVFYEWTLEGVGEFYHTKLMVNFWNICCTTSGQAFKSVWCCWSARTAGDQCDNLRLIYRTNRHGPSCQEHGLATGTKLVARKIQDDPHLAEKFSSNMKDLVIAITYS